MNFELLCSFCFDIFGLVLMVTERHPLIAFFKNIDFLEWSTAICVKAKQSIAKRIGYKVR